MAFDPLDTTSTEYALFYEYRKPRGGERPDDKVAPMSLAEAHQRIEALKHIGNARVRRVSLLSRTVRTIRSPWEPASPGADT